MASDALIGRDGRRYPVDEPRWRGDDGSPLMVAAQPGLTRADVDPSVRSQWRYAAALPLRPAPVSLGEGCTPLLDVRISGVALAVKPEWFNPTGSFKDRGTSVMVSVLAHQGIGAVVEDSSGNGGASVAAYAAAAGIRATILAPESTSEAKTLQSRMHGAEVELVPGTRQATAEEAVRRSARTFYASHNWHPFFLEGTKLIAYEIWEDLGFRAPDAVLVPAGAGSLVLGCAIGFGELLRSGAIGRMPRLLAVQPENCAPLARAFAAGAASVSPARWSPTLAEGTAITHPVRDVEVLAAVRSSGGEILAVPEAAIPPAVRELAARGLYAEPTSALVAAALPDLAARGVVADGDTVVTVLTGSGLKAAGTMSAILRASP
ncbi:pyridoxal-phosphate dependent enzyme [Marinitenerispora sediminis]|uniref:Pyridoxal-5'-phosphate-dependent protein subunit beta n=1 Tax=Marinitenerispora sediminis TaxID=1931232 RepID=A0A368T1K5_9ACTN|nr:pyridoxal-phosphate dependent enzyme [Marinitenerispora sediminis]RCV52548.1 pyridoxal-5'-phosphate-dependent protein subunit beta [Marinitenerispora sediminis]RCV53778.1 pyridoxal-5'-phosphate-dependent protein subunit beta [Marinitenerispora sediminis]RCV59614.1 pyridoxal-5'-phosphate-dependent protein subunit beta [Marinitenerispora sediminis]